MDHIGKGHLRARLVYRKADMRTNRQQYDHIRVHH